MSTKFLERLFNNWIAKVVSLLLALLIFMMYKSSQLSEKDFAVPIKILQNGNLTVVASKSPVSAVKVTVRGKSSQLLEVSENDLEAYVDINSQVAGGTYDFPVFIKPSGRLVLMEPLEIKLAREKVSLTVEEKVIRYVPVEATLAGTPARGYQVESVSVNPPYVKVSGPKSLVEGISFVQTEKIDIQGITRNSVQEASLFFENDIVKIESGEQYEVTVVTEPSPLTKDFPGVQIEYRNLDSAFEITSLAQTTDIRLKGQMLQVENSDASVFRAEADCSAIKEEGAFEVPVYVVVPQGLEIDSQSKTRIRITVSRRIVPETVPSETVPGELEPPEVHDQ
ncbi:MAG TPA: hypothetical protein DCP61_05145 [Treponema sp.]|nr:hypothetical protein [Treponema sp.]